jgi:hypothetical protein
VDDEDYEFVALCAFARDASAGALPVEVWERLVRQAKRGCPMRRLMLSLFVLSMLLSMVGCHCTLTQGICDCAGDDYCTSRSPWVNHGSSAVDQSAPMSPAPMPDVKAKGF